MSPSRRSLLTAAATFAIGRATSAADPGAPAVDRETLVVGLERGFSNLDALAAITSDSDRYNLQIYDGLLGFDPTGRIELRRATSRTVSEDGLSYTFTLRPGTRFHNGQILTGRDVAFSVEHILDPANKSTRRPQLAPVIAAVDVPDDLTVTFRLKTEDGAFVNKIAGYLPLIPRDYGSTLPQSEFFSRSPISLGPYRVGRFAENGQMLELERFDDYRGTKPGVRRLIFKVLPDAGSRTNALLAGEIDAAVGVPFQDQERLGTIPWLQAIAVPVGSPYMAKIYANVPGIPENKIEVRQALNYAVDKQAIIQNVLHGAGENLATAISRYYPYGTDPALAPYAYDPAKAHALLAQAGYPRGFRTKLYVGNDHPREVAEALAAYWGQVGVQTSIELVDYATWSRLNNTHQTVPMTIQQMANAIYDPIHPVLGLFSREGSWCDYDNAEVQTLIDQAIPVRDVPARDALFRKIGRLLHDDPGAVYISELYQTYAKKKDLAWAPAQGTGLLDFRTAGWRV